MAGALLRGRGSVLAQLRAGLVGAAAGSARTVLVEGEPGSGKTAVCREVIRSAAEAEFLVVPVAGVEAEADLPLAGLSMVLRHLADQLDDLIVGLPPGQRRAVRAAAGLSDEAIIDRFALGAALLGVLAAAADGRSLLLVIDDAHWLDGMSADAVSFALRRLAADAVLVVVATRPDECRLALPDHTERSRIGGLAEADVAAMLDDAGLRVAPPVCRAIVAATGGLPLAALETASVMSASQRAGTAPLPDPLPIGREVTAAYRSRLERLPELTRVAVATVAAAGSAPCALIRAALTELGVDLADLDPAEEIGALSVDPLGVRFTHPLLSAAALQLPTPSERRRYHHALATAARGEPERRARHLIAASAGPDEDAAMAISAAAAEVAHHRGLPAAAPLLVQAAALSPPGEPRYARLLTAATALGVAGHTQDAVEAAREVISGTSDPPRRADAAMVIAETSTWGTDTDDVLALALHEASRIGPVDRHRTVRALTQASMGATVVGALPRARRLAEQATGLLDADTPGPIRAEAESVHAMILVLTGGHSRAETTLNGWSMPAAHTITAADLYAARFPSTVQTLIRLGRYRDADDLVHELSAVCRRESSPIGKAYVLATAAELRWWKGQWLPAVSIGEEAIGLADETRQFVLGWYIRAITARTFAAQGDQDRCRGYAGAALRVADSHRLRPLRLYALAALGLLELGVGAAADSAALLVEADLIRDDCGWRDPAAVPFGGDLIEALARAGQVREANAALEKHHEAALASGSRWAEATMARCRAIVAVDPDESDAQFARALELNPPEVPFEAARTRLCWGEHLRRRRQIVTSRTLLHDALATFERLHARPWADRAATELRAAGRRPRSNRTSELAALTPQELRCALAVAEGLSNRDVAASLFLSPKTVEYHLHKVYIKLGITSRTQLARLLDATQRDGQSDRTPPEQPG